MRLGGPVEKTTDVDRWIKALREKGYRAAYWPLPFDAAGVLVQEFTAAAKEADIVIAEVGAWSNPLSPDGEERKTAFRKCVSALEIAERVEARCCVNIAGSLGEKWDGPYPDDLTETAFEMIVETVRKIHDEVRPQRTFYTLETMPWMYPDSADSYLRLLDAIDRPGVAAHFDPVNIINSPSRYFRNGDIIREFVDKLGIHIKSCHAKDIVLGKELTTHLDECRPGTGGLDFTALLTSLSALDATLPLMMEHLSDPSEYDPAAAYIRAVAREAGVAMDFSSGSR